MVKISVDLARYNALPGDSREMQQAIAIVQIRSINGSVVAILFPPRKDVKRSISLLPYRIDNYCNNQVVTIYQVRTHM